MGGNNPAFRRGKLAAIPDLSGQWVNVCAVMTAPFDMELYINGINVGGNSTGSSNAPMASSFVGDRAKSGHQVSNDGATYRMKGLIDEMRLWNRALTAAEIRAGMCKKLSGNELGLVGYWNFDETTGTAVADKSPNAFTGQLINNATRVYSGAPIGDKSSFSYQANWTGVVKTETEGLETVEVSDIQGAPEGIHTYVVTSAPSQTTGLNVLPIPNIYFGVFLAATDLNNTFTVKHSTGGNSCGISRRVDNSTSSWIDETSTMTGVVARTELIGRSTIGNLQIDLGMDETVCPFVLRTLRPLSDPTGCSFMWQNGSTQPTFQPATYGTYWVTVTKDCLSDKDTITFLKAPKTEFFFDLGDDKLICPLSSIELRPLNNPTGFEFTWQNGSKQSSFIVKEYGKYKVTVENECTIGSDSISILKQEIGEVSIPNVFTPNDDQWNQTFVIDNKLLGSQLVVYNRWGEEVYTSSSYYNNWNGNGLPAGIYFYLIKSPCTTDTKGWLSLIR